MVKAQLILYWAIIGRLIFSGSIGEWPKVLAPLLLIPALGAVLLLSACSSPIPKAGSSETWIGLKEETPNDLNA